MKIKTRLLAGLMAVICCFGLFSVTAFAADGYFSSNENGDVTPPEYIDSISISSQDVQKPSTSDTVPGIAWDLDAEEIGDFSDIFSGILSILGSGKPLTPNGNLSLIDDILQDESYFVQDEKVVKDKQFITVQSKNGNYFYIVIDRSGDTENVYFLNLVDEADLFTLLDEEQQDAVKTCTCKDRCEVGAVNTDCSLCKTNMSECAGKTAVEPTEKEPDVTPEPEQTPAATENKNTDSLLLIVLLLAIVGGGALYWFKFRKEKPDAKGSSVLDDYDFGEDDEDEEYETEEDTITEDEGE